jgi:hypothetical protein
VGALGVFTTGAASGIVASGIVASGTTSVVFVAITSTVGINVAFDSSCLGVATSTME